MAKTLNWSEVTKVSKSSGGGGGNRMTIQDGETVAIKFLIPDDGSEPYAYKRHYIKDKGYHVCAEDAAEDGKHDGCVFCREASGKGGPVGRLSRVFAFSVYDPRKTHVFKEPVKIPGTDKTGRYIPCTGDATCKYCRKGDEPRVNGVRHWTLSGKAAQQLRTWALQVLGKACASCGRGKIKVKGYECPRCGEPMDIDDPEEKSRCFECTENAKKQGKGAVSVIPKETLACSQGCEDARRLDLTDVWVDVTRSGSTQDTTYNFTRSQTDEEELPKDVKPVDFKASSDFKPAPANEQAATLGIKNPFKGKRRDENDEDDEDDDEDDAPKSKRSRHEDDDEDDDDDDSSSSIFGRKKR